MSHNYEDHVIFKRRSIRKFIENKPVEKEKLDFILRAAMQAPSSKNKQPWEFLILDDRNEIEKIVPLQKKYTLLSKAPITIIILANKEVSNKSEDESIYWFPFDISCANENLHLAATEVGLATVWLSCYPKMDNVKELQAHFNLPEHIIPFAVMPLGYSEDESYFKDKYDESKIHYNKY